MIRIVICAVIGYFASLSAGLMLTRNTGGYPQTGQRNIGATNVPGYGAKMGVLTFLATAKGWLPAHWAASLPAETAPPLPISSPFLDITGLFLRF